MIVLAFLSSARAEGEKMPFPHGVTYPFGIKPTNHTQAEMNADTLQMWQAWRAKYVVSEGAGGNLRVTKYGPKGTTVSEGIGYGMLISVYIARPDNSGRSDFDALYRYYLDKVKIKDGINYGLMAGLVGGDGVILDNWVAPDGDIDAAFALLVADQQWGSTGPINYRQGALDIIAQLMQYSINKPSFIVSRGEFESSFTMSSYQIVSYFAQFAAASGDARWLDVVDNGYKMYDYFLNLNPATGLTPYCLYTKGYGPLPYEEKGRAYTGRHYDFSFDACRTPWRVGLDYLWHGTAHSPLARALPDVQTKWAERVTGGDPQMMQSRYTLDGTPHPKAFTGNQRNMITPMATAAMVDASNQAWLNTLYAWMRQQVPGERFEENGASAHANYFEDTVLMINMLIVTGNMPNVALTATSAAPRPRPTVPPPSASKPTPKSTAPTAPKVAPAPPPSTSPASAPAPASASGVPVITNAPPPGTVNVEYEFRFTAENSPHTFSVKPRLPRGLTLEPTTGEIFGLPSESGNFTLSFRAFNAKGGGEKTVTLQIKAKK
jgi:endo-1,4-beta-D-glucanase Y